MRLPPVRPTHLREFVGDGDHVATGGDRGTLYIWEVATLRQPRAIQAHDQPVTAVAFSPDGRILAVGRPSPTVWVWDLRGNRQWWWLTEPNKTAQTLTFAPTV